MDRLAEDVWGGDPPEGWVTTLQTYVFHLRRALEPDRVRGIAGENVLVTRGRGYLLPGDREHLDAALFQDGFTAGAGPRWSAGRYAEAAVTLRQALGRWRSGVLADLADYAFIRPEAGRLEELRLAALEARIDADLALGRHDTLNRRAGTAGPLSIRCGSGCTASSCWRCIAAAVRRRPWPPTGVPVTCSPTSSASIPESRCGTCTHRSWPTTRRSTGAIAVRS